MTVANGFDIKKFCASPEEINSLREICRLWQQDDGFWSFDQILDSLGHPQVKLHYLKGDQSAVWLGAVFYRVNVDQAELVYLYVRPDSRSLGIAQRLMRHMLIDLQTDTQIDSLLLEVKRTNLNAQRLYEYFGMTYLRTIKRYYSSGEDALVYILNLKR